MASKVVNHYHINALKALMKAEDINGILIQSEINRFWFTGFSSSFGYLFINSYGKSCLLIDSRYYFAALEKIHNVDEIILYEPSLLTSTLKKLNITKLGIEGDYLTVNEFTHLQKLFLGVELVPINTKGLRRTKTPHEIKMLTKAAKIAASTVNWIRKQNLVGKTEIAIANLITSHMLDLGASKNSFDPIVASGKNGAIPHHHPTKKKVRDGELITIDIGCIYEGYCSDITRTFIVGNKHKTFQKLKEIYQIVYDAQQAGLMCAQRGIKTSDIDDACRNYIQQKGYGEYFQHSTGHGVGIEVHELPWISYTHQQLLKPYDVYTVEPGIYIPNLGGVRIEDTVYLDENYQVINLTQSALKKL